MRVLIDACVLYPTVMREILLGVAKAGLFTPLWSDRILEEWARAVARNLPDQAAVARGEIALLRANWPTAEVAADLSLETELHLPDDNDNHVLAAAISGQAEVLLTQNTKDFPQYLLTPHRVVRRDPDGFLWEYHSQEPDLVAEVCTRVHAQAVVLSGQSIPLRRLLKKARLPRLAKASTAD